MATLSQELAKLKELRQRFEEQGERLDELYEEYADGAGDGETVNVEIPVAGRANQSESVEVSRDNASSDTVSEEIPLQGGDASDPDTMRVEQDRGSGMEEVEEWDEKLHEMRVEEEEERQERKRRHRDRMNASPYSLDEDQDGGEVDVPAAGRRNREDRKDE